MKTFPLEPIEKASRKKLRELQLERLRWSIRRAWDKVPHYRKKFQKAGVKPSDLKTLADLEKFPFTTKADLRENYPFGMFAVPMDKIVREGAYQQLGMPKFDFLTAEDVAAVKGYILTRRKALTDAAN